MKQRLDVIETASREDEAFRFIEGDMGLGLILLCDHAENTIPDAYADLGLGREDLHRHIGYDIGVAGVTEHLAAQLGAPALLSRFSRLLIDPNRGLDDPTLVMQISDGIVVPANADLSRGEIASRIERFYLPYHRAVDREIKACLAAGRAPVLLSLHSFTQAWKSVPRPWFAAVLWDRDQRLAQPLLAGLNALPGVVVGDNEPYSGQLKGDTLYQHGTLRGLAHALVEIRQDLILSPEGQAEWASHLAAVLRGILKDRTLAPGLHAMVHHGSATDRRPAEAGGRSEDEGGRFMDEKTRTELEAAAFRRLVEHLRKRTDVQNIDLMDLAGFCRNCLSNWYQEAAAAKGIALDKDTAREIVYGMPYDDWKAKFQLVSPAPRKTAVKG